MNGAPPSLRTLFWELYDVRKAPVPLFERVLEPWIPAVHRLLAPLRSFQSLGDAPATQEALYDWYALSRVNDLLLLAFQTLPTFYAAPSPYVDEPMRGAHLPPRMFWSAAPFPLPPERYLDFFVELGFVPFGARPFHPFHHEIVAVTLDEAADESPVVDHVYWPGLLWGEMLFSRAGVRVRCRPGVLSPRIAENAPLYFAYERFRRPTIDNSIGWGHVSQWVTDFRRDYDSGEAYHFNVDGAYPLGDDATYRAAWATSDDPDDGPLGDLTMEERIELLVHRHFVRCEKPPWDLWPFHDTYQIAKG